MLFNSVAFLIFLPVVWLAYHALRTNSSRALLLLGASYLFYMWWRVEYVVLLLVSTAVDYTVALLIYRTSRANLRRVLLCLSIGVNLALLCTFKYFNFFAGQLSGLSRVFVPDFEMPVLDFVLPVGISFYTFQTMSYTIEVFRRKQDPERNPIRFALYVSFFPQLVAGPIERPGRLLPQIRAPKEADADAVVSGLRLMLWGMFKKVVVADRLAAYVDLVYDQPMGHNGAQLVLATVFFAVQIYCDFSGYTDIAIGCARTFGFDLMKNFRRPYLAWCPTEFWRRWHISLSNWFRDYVYIPLGGSRRGVSRTAINLLLTFLVSGLWHGANWTFLAWGGVHGMLVLAERGIRRMFGIQPQRLPPKWRGRLLGTALTIPCVLAAWVFFRADSIHSALFILRNFLSNPTLFNISCGMGAAYLWSALALITVVLAFDVCEEYGVRGDRLTLWDVVPAPVRWCGYWSMALCLVLFGQLGEGKQFLYFQF